MSESGHKKAGLIKIVRRFFWLSLLLTRQALSFRTFIKLNPNERKSSNTPQVFVKKLIQLGPTFIKLGQILSTRPDFLPKEYIDELKVLQDQVPPFPFSEVQSIIQSEFKDKLDNLYSSFQMKPVAAASLSQVHFAVLKDGTKMAVKIQRPYIKETIQLDLIVLSGLIKIIRTLFPTIAGNLNLSSAFNEFKTYTLRELDFLTEGATLEKFRENFKHWKDVTFPQVYSSHTTDRILTMERVDGRRVEEIAYKIPESTRIKLNKRLVEAEMKMFISDAFFHADLHPGNIFFKEDGSIAIIDVGMYGELTDQQRDRFLLYWLAIVEKEKIRAFSHLIKLGTSTNSADEKGFYKQFNETLDKFYDSNITERSLTKTYLEIFVTGARFGFIFPSQLLLQAKALTTAESLAFALVPEFRFAEEARPIVTRELASRGDFEQLRMRFNQTFPEWLLLGELSHNSLGIGQEGANFDTVWKELARMWGSELDRGGKEETEIIHGEHAVIIHENLEKVFNFVTRFAQYPHWHPTYTEKSRVIHVSGRYIFITPKATGSIFRLDEIVDGTQLLSNGEIIQFERNKLFKWKAPLSLCPLIYIGTSFHFEDLGNNQTRLYENFYFIDHPLADVFVSRKWFSVEALSQHIKEELAGVKNIIESSKYNPEDMECLWDNIVETTRL